MQENQGHKHFDYLRRLGSDYLDFDKCVEKECHLVYNKKQFQYSYSVSLINIREYH